MRRLDVPKFHLVEDVKTTDRKQMQSDLAHLKGIAKNIGCEVEVSHAFVNGELCLIWGSEKAKDFTTMFLALNGDQSTKDGWSFTPSFGEGASNRFKEEWSDTLMQLVAQEGVPARLETTPEGNKKFCFHFF